MVTRDPHNARLQEAFDLFQQGDREQALAVLYGIVTNAPLHRDAWWMVANVATQEQQVKHALEQVLQIDPTHKEARAMAFRMEMVLAPEPSYKPPYQNQQPQQMAMFPDEAAAASASGAGPVPVMEREVIYVDRGAAGRLQPLLVLNGGLTSGCFSLVLTLLASSVLAFMAISGTISTILQEVGTLAAGQSVSLALIPSIAATAFLTFLRGNPLPIDLSGAVGWVSGVTGGNLILPDPNSIYDAALRGLWNSQGYPAITGDRILARLGELGPQISGVGWLVPLMFLGLWLALAFLLVFLRARSSRLLHWFLSTVGVWIMIALAVFLGTQAYQLIAGAP